MSGRSDGMRNIGIQVELKCKNCSQVSPKRTLAVEVAIQTDWSIFHEGDFYRDQTRKGALFNGDRRSSVVSPTQGTLIANGKNLNLSSASCSFSQCGSCLSCKYVNGCDSAEVSLGINSQEHFCPSLPEPACISVDSNLRSKVRNFKRGRRKIRGRTEFGTSGRSSPRTHYDGFEPAAYQTVIKTERNCCADENDAESDCEPLPEAVRSSAHVVDTNKKTFKRRLVCKNKIGTKKKFVQKTNFMSAGLYSDAFKSDEKMSESEPRDVFHGLPLPIHYGKHLLKKQFDFQLPYDVWATRELNKKQIPSPAYKKIKNNIYVDVRPVCKDFEPNLCNCQPPSSPEEKGCTDNCLNKMVYTECDPDLCVCGDQCDNQRIQKHQAFTDLKEFPTEDRGYGVMATKPITAGRFVMEYIGEVVSEQEFRRRMSHLYSSMEHHYCLSLDGGAVIDGYRCGNISRLINHSCSPNCEMQKWNVNGAPRIGLFALNDIEVGEELTYDYNFHAYNINAQQECKCGSENCRKLVGGKGQRVLDATNSYKCKSSKVGFFMRQAKRSINRSMQHYLSLYNGLPTMRERKLIGRKSLLLLRNLKKVRRVLRVGDSPVEKEFSPEEDSAKKAEVFMTQFTAINTSRSVRTRQLSKAEGDDIVLRMSFLAQVFMQVFNNVINCKDELGNSPSNLFYHLPSKKKFPMLYGIVSDPVDLSTIERNISSGKYSTSSSFHADFMKFFHVAEKICSDGTSLELMKSRYSSSLENARSFLESVGDVLPPNPDLLQTSSSSSSGASLYAMSPISSPLMAASFDLHPTRQESPRSSFDLLPTRQESPRLSFDLSPPVGGRDGDDDDDDEDDVIRCVCGLVVDEGVMMQCENCQTWQHQFCVGATEDEENYLCHLCGPRKVSKEVLLSVQPKDGEAGCLYYITLMRGDLQVKVGDAVYIAPDDMLTFPSSLDKFPSARLDDAYGHLLAEVEKLDIFRIENLWTNQNGERLMHGHYFLRPSDIYHDASQKFFEKEVLKAPSLCSTLTLGCVVAPCYIMDVQSYNLGRPRGFEERDVYVCEFKVDKNWRTIKKPLKISHPVNRARFCFSRFAEKMNFKRTYTPHAIPSTMKINQKSNLSVERDRQTSPRVLREIRGHPAIDGPQVRELEEKKKRLEGFVGRLSGEQTC